MPTHSQNGENERNARLTQPFTCLHMSNTRPVRPFGLEDCCHAKWRSDPIPPVANPCCNRVLVGVVPTLGRQCDDAISSKELLVQRPPGRLWHARSRANTCGASACYSRQARMMHDFRPSSARSYRSCRVWVGALAATCGSTPAGLPPMQPPFVNTRRN